MKKLIATLLLAAFSGLLAAQVLGGLKRRPWSLEDRFAYRDAQTHILIYQQQIDRLVALQKDWHAKSEEVENKNLTKGYHHDFETLEEVEDGAPAKTQ